MQMQNPQINPVISVIRTQKQLFWQQEFPNVPKLFPFLCMQKQYLSENQVA